MRNLYAFVLLLILPSCFLNGQNLTSKELIKAWKVSDKTQTIQAEKTYDDLRVNYSEEKFDKVIGELYNYLKKNPDPRLEIRIYIYDILGHRSRKEPTLVSKEENMKKLFEKTFSFKDKQLLSEVYSLYAEQGAENIEDQLFYNTYAIEIQEEIGAQYFPKLYARYISLSTTYYYVEDYEESLKTGYKILNLLNNKNDYVYALCLQYDIMGASYYELNQIDSGIIYYEKIKNLLADKNGIETHKITHLKQNDLKIIWDGVAKGGIARGLITNGMYDEATSLLNENLASSTIYNQYNDLAKTQNLLAIAQLKKGNTKQAIKLWHDARKSAEKLKADNRYLIYVADNLSETYKSMERFDSAYFYLQQKFQYENERFSKINQSRLNAVNMRLQLQKMESKIKDAELTIERQNSNRNIIILGSFGVFLILIISYGKYRAEQKLKVKQLEMQQKISQIDKQKIEDELNAARSSIKGFIAKVNEKNELIEAINGKLDEAKQIHSSEKKELEVALGELRDTKIITDDDWKEFQIGFDRVYVGFSKNLIANHPAITPAEQRYLMLSKIGLNHKEMARALGISTDSVRVTWNRVRNKMGGTLDDTPQSLMKKYKLDANVA